MRSRPEIGVLLGVLALVAHGLAALRFAKLYLGLPMEAGGLFLGPLLGMPLLVYGVLAIGVAVVLLVSYDAARWPALQVLLVTFLLDFAMLCSGLVHPYVVVGTIGTVAALGVILLQVPRTIGDQWETFGKH